MLHQVVDERRPQQRLRLAVPVAGELAPQRDRLVDGRPDRVRRAVERRRPRRRRAGDAAPTRRSRCPRRCRAFAKARSRSSSVDSASSSSNGSAGAEVFGHVAEPNGRDQLRLGGREGSPLACPTARARPPTAVPPRVDRLGRPASAAGGQVSTTGLRRGPARADRAVADRLEPLAAARLGPPERLDQAGGEQTDADRAGRRPRSCGDVQSALGAYSRKSVTRHDREQRCRTRRRGGRTRWCRRAAPRRAPARSTPARWSGTDRPGARWRRCSTPATSGNTVETTSATAVTERAATAPRRRAGSATGR